MNPVLQPKPHVALCNNNCRNKAEMRSQNGKQTVVQPKLELTTPGDTYEQEADRMADFVMRKSSSGLGSEQPSTTSIFPPTISRNSNSSGGVTVGASTESGINASRGSGQPMPNALLTQMESGFGQNFSAVRLHTGSNAVQMNRDLGAKAFTYGNDIYFNSGQYQPHSHQGLHLLAHELTHVVQQNGKVGREPYYPNIYYDGPTIQAGPVTNNNNNNNEEASYVYEFFCAILSILDVKEALKLHEIGKSYSIAVKEMQEALKLSSKATLIIDKSSIMPIINGHAPIPKFSKLGFVSLVVNIVEFGRSLVNFDKEYLGSNIIILSVNLLNLVSSFFSAFPQLIVYCPQAALFAGAWSVGAGAGNFINFTVKAMTGQTPGEWLVPDPDYTVVSKDDVMNNPYYVQGRINYELNEIYKNGGGVFIDENKKKAIFDHYRYSIISYSNNFLRNLKNLKFEQRIRMYDNQIIKEVSLTEIEAKQIETVYKSLNLL